MVKNKQPEKKGRLVLKSRLNVIIANIEQVEQRKITDTEVSGITGLSRPTIRKYRIPKALDRIDASVVTALCEWAGVELGDLLYVEYEDGSSVR